MIWLKSCSRCLRGDMFLDQDAYGMRFRQCVQCGHIDELTAIPVNAPAASPARSRPRSRATTRANACRTGSGIRELAG